MTCISQSCASIVDLDILHEPEVDNTTIRDRLGMIYTRQPKAENAAGVTYRYRRIDGLTDRLRDSGETDHA